ncbi:MAG TPA: metalloregulator ArsR/SmtB family transcription factor [Gemmatimonadaceae bacterium]|nr:metalloregulator ArsR/SmtB family transcription factor [Gemmatimonadaceae bacterium]
MPTDSLSLAFAALADPTRRAILARLATGECTAGELARPFAMSGPAVSKHLKVLERAGLVARGRDAQRRPRRLQAAPIKKVAEWADDYRQFWDASYERLDAYLTRLMVEESNDGAAK